MIKEIKRKETIMETIDTLIEKLLKRKEELGGDTRIMVQYRDGGGDYSGWDDKVYDWVRKDEKGNIIGLFL